ncbi:zinc-binding alcohol dehydrogenase [Pontibacillus salicampi]|uniref:Zinc-binding alcohol dehydrogenase n=1 Tax=Pontibacillus salicampi TaxID=1449801 RepID=A0ABV6LQL3_9BACI
MRKIIATNQSVQLKEVPKPEIKPNYILVRTVCSAISPGTEGTIINNSTGKEIPLGYSAMGRVEACGDGMEGVREGDMVACYGAPYVQHAEYMLVPKTLFAKVPDQVPVHEAAIAGLGAIAIHALRKASLQFGETVVIAGLGVLGQLIARIADAAAYQVIGYDIQAPRVEMVQEGTSIVAFSDKNEMEEELKQRTNHYGADAVLLCAGGKHSPLTSHGLEWVRDKGKVVIVGDIEPHFPRHLLFQKEAEIHISRAGGPGRYDKVYEQQAIDYPYGFIRWTEGRNIEAYIRLIENKRIDVSNLTKDGVDFESSPNAYKDLREERASMLTKMIYY